ncbi:VWA domain-containing protein [Candidatus Dependentiae bacterium]|nr:VWA domain-containing protein [Candidatus Dependentiae bacterium]
MFTDFHIAYPWHMFYAFLFLVAGILVRYLWQKRNFFVYPLANYLEQRGLSASSFYDTFFYLIRLSSLLLMILLIGKPQWVDHRSKIQVEGVDIILVMDVSGSMLSFDDMNDRRSRWDIARTEALRFIDKRENDAIGLVIFGRYAIARCPLTQDKQMLKSIISQLEIGMPTPDMVQETMLSQAIITASRRLQKSQAKSKVMVLLTDGAPSPGDLPAKAAIDIAKKMNIKIYTIGIGGDQAGYGFDPIFGMKNSFLSSSLRAPPLNKQLLEEIAQETGGKFFEAKKTKDLKKIYDKIDELEKVSYETEVYNQFHDYFLPFLWLIIGLVLIEFVMATFWWFIF